MLPAADEVQTRAMGSLVRDVAYSAAATKAAAVRTVEARSEAVTVVTVVSDTGTAPSARGVYGGSESANAINFANAMKLEEVSRVPL